MEDFVNTTTPSRMNYRKARRINATYGANEGMATMVRDDAYAQPAEMGYCGAYCDPRNNGGCNSCDKVRSKVGVVPQPMYANSLCPPYGGMFAKQELRMHPQWTKPDSCMPFEVSVGPTNLIDNPGCDASRTFRLGPNRYATAGGRCAGLNCGLFGSCGKRQGQIDYGLVANESFMNNMDAVNNASDAPGASGATYSSTVDLNRNDGFKSGRFSIKTQY